MSAGLRAWRYVILRRLTQSVILLSFLGSVRWGWELSGLPILRGNLSASELLGKIPLADPFATLQLLFTGRLPGMTVLIGAVAVLAFYAAVGGRVFCSWVCPVNPVTDLAGWLRRSLALPHGPRFSRDVRYWVLGLTLFLTPLVGVAAFEWISPIGMLHRGLIYGMGFGWVAVGAVFVLDLLVVQRGFCGHLCPLGAFYGLVGRAAQVRIRFDAESCTRCGECAIVCPEPQVLNLVAAAEAGMVASGDCTNCGRCTPVCPQGSLSFDWRWRIGSAAGKPSDRHARGAT